MNGVKNIPGADQALRNAQADAKPDARVEHNNSAPVKDKPSALTSAPRDIKTHEPKTDSPSASKTAERSEQSHSNQLKTARLGDLERQRQHVLSRLEKPREDSSIKHPQQEVKEHPRALSEKQQKADKHDPELKAQQPKALEHESKAKEGKALDHELKSLRHELKKEDVQAGKQESQAEKREARNERAESRLEERLEKQTSKLEQQAEKQTEKLEKQVEKQTAKLEKQAEKLEEQADKLKSRVERDNSNHPTQGSRGENKERGHEAHGRGRANDDSHNETRGSNREPQGNILHEREKPLDVKQTVRDARETLHNLRDQTQAARDAARDAVRDARHQVSGKEHGNGNSGHGKHVEKPSENHPALKFFDKNLPSRANESLNGLKHEARQELGRELRGEAQRALDMVAKTLGRDVVSDVMRGRGEKIEKFVTHLLRQTGNEVPRGEQKGTTPEHVVRQTARQVADAVQLARHFSQLEKTGGRSVSQAEDAAWRLLLREPKSDGQTTRPNSYQPAELLRDLRAGAFRPATELRNPFPLTGRARVVSEMIELMHTLDAIESMQHEGGGEGASLPFAGLGLSGVNLPDVDLSKFDLEAIARFLVAEGGEALSEGLFGMLRMLPGRAARVEMMRMMATLVGPLVDAQGRPLVSQEGIALKPERLLCLNTASGLLAGGFDAEAFPVRLSPLIVNGLDALYSLIGFDGRTLASPHFAAVQVQVNASDLEWVFGHPPLTEGWARTLIEHLKDSAMPDLNQLGEMLEEALLDGRFHTVLLQGAVAEGETVPGSFSMTCLSPGETTPAFA